MAQQMNIFISHVHEDDDELSKLKSLVSMHGLEIRDASITKDKPNNAKNEDYIFNDIIKPGIEWCGVLAVYITPKTKESKWVDKEINLAEKKGKRIVGIWADGHAGCEPPENLKKLADAMVGWKGERIVDALTGNFNEWEDPKSGEVCPPRPFKRVKCQ